MSNDITNDLQNTASVGMCYAGTIGVGAAVGRLGGLPGMILGAAVGAAVGTKVCGSPDNPGIVARGIKKKVFSGGDLTRVNENVNKQLGMKIPASDIKGAIKSASSSGGESTGKKMSLPHARAKSVWLRAKYGNA